MPDGRAIVEWLKSDYGLNRHGRARCPAHNGQDRNLSARLEGDKVLLTCHSHGCTYEQIAALCPNGDRSEPETREFEYRDPDGKHYHSAFRQGDGPDKKCWQRPGLKTRPLPYRIEHAADWQADGAVVIVEGEPCADRLAELGYAAVTWCGGAAKVERTDWSAIAGWPAVLWPDNDEPGREAMNKLAPVLEALGCTLRHVTVPEDKRAKWDCKDATADEAHRLIADTVKCPAPGVLTVIDDWGGPPPPPRRFLAKDWIPWGRFTLFAGDGGLGKTRAMIQLAVEICIGGLTWFAHESGPKMDGEAGRVLFASWEDEAEEFQRRLYDWPEIAGLHAPTALRARLGDRLGFVDMKGKGPLWGADNALTPQGTHLRQEAQGRGAKLLVLDSLAAVFAGNENDRPAVRAFIADWDAWATAAECAVVLVAHPPKNTGAAYSGSTDWRNGARSLLVMEREDGETILRCDKSNYAALPDPYILRDWKWWAAEPKADTDDDAELDEAILAVLKRQDMNKTETRRVIGRQQRAVSLRIDALLARGAIVETIPANKNTKYKLSDSTG